MTISLLSSVSGNLTALPSNVYYVSQWTEYDKSGVLWVVLVTGLTYIVTSVGIRYTSRRGSISSVDDWMLWASAAISIFQHACLFVAVRHGFGKASDHISAQQEVIAAKATYASLVLFVLTHGLSKLSVLLLMRRLFTSTYAAASLFYALLAAIVGWAVLSILLLTAKCPPSWLFGEIHSCPGLMARQTVMCILDMVTETILVVLLAVLACKFLVQTQQRVLVIGSFAIRLPVIIFLALFLASSHRALETDDRTLTYPMPIAWLQVALVWSVVTASVPSLRSILQPFRIARRISTGPTPKQSVIVVSRELGVTWES